MPTIKVGTMCATIELICKLLTKNQKQKAIMIRNTNSRLLLSWYKKLDFVIEKQLIMITGDPQLVIKKLEE